MENEARSMAGLLYVLKDEKCMACAGVGTAYGPGLNVTCGYCDGKGFRTFKIELSDALRRIKGA